MVLKRLPEALGDQLDDSVFFNKNDNYNQQEVVDKLQKQGLPAVAATKTKQLTIVIVKKVWKFMLEAKGLTHSPAINHRLRRLLGSNKQVDSIDPVPLNLSYEGREQELLERIKRHPKDLQLYASLAQFYVDNESLEEAATLYEYLSRHDKGNVNYLTQAALLNFRLKNYQKSVDQLNETVALDSSDPNSYYYLGLSYQELGQVEEADQAFSLAKQLDPDNPLYPNNPYKN